MTGLDALGAGQLPPQVLQGCRLEGFGVEAFGREPIAALLRGTSLVEGVELATPTLAALIAPGTGTALFADLHDGNIVRLWRLGGGAPGPQRPRVAVAADHDLSQSRTPVHFEAGDHPKLDPAAAPLVAAAALLATAFDYQVNGPSVRAPLLRVHAFVRRALSGQGRTAALFGMVVVPAAVPRQPLTFNVAALCGPGRAPQLVIDRAGLAAAQARPWTPHL